MHEDRERWNRKHRDQSHTAPAARIVTRFAPQAPTGLALDLAAGSGRHARYLARHGFTVEALDISEVGLGRLGAHPRVRRVCLDLDRYDLPVGRYQLILAIRYLNRRLFPQMIRALAPGGMLLVETFLAEPPGGAVNSRFRREYLLEENELLHAFAALRILYYEESASREPDTPARLASLAAVHAARDAAISPTLPDAGRVAPP
jgi:SAM-dependent methyltransferase